MLVARLVTLLFMVAVALTMLVAAIVQSFTREPQSWYFYPLLVLGLAAWLGFAALIGGAGVYVRESGVVVVNPFRVSSLRWDEIERFSLDESPKFVRGLIGRVHCRGGGSTILWGIRPFGDPYGKRQAQEAVAFLNQTLASHVADNP
jgi:Bacterial PH domain